MKPYFYIIQHKLSGKIYVGSQYGKKSDPTNLLKTYFTSSKTVNNTMKEDGINSFIILLIEERQDAREYEQKYLLKTYREIGRDKFLEEYFNRNLSPGILLTEDMIERANEKRKVSNSLSAKKLIKEGRHNFQLFPNAGCKQENREKSSKRMLGNTLCLGRIVSDETKNKIAEGAKGNTNVRNTKWWNNGNERRRSTTSPGEEWKEGFKINRY